MPYAERHFLQSENTPNVFVDSDVAPATIVKIMTIIRSTIIIFAIQTSVSEFTSPFSNFRGINITYAVSLH